MILDHIKAVIFDLDGTLVDSMWMWEDIDIEYLGRYGLSCPEDLQKAIEGMSFTETAVYFKERFGLPDSIEEIKEAWIAMSLEKYEKEVPLNREHGNFWRSLQPEGFPQALPPATAEKWYPLY